MTEADGRPVLHHLRFSHYNEKARWALDYKGIPHMREASLPLLHAFKARRLAKRDRTFPILVVEGDVVQGSDRIVARLEQIKPDPPLYPADEGERRRAIELEAYFDKQIGPHIRRLFFFHMLPDTDRASALMSQGFGDRSRHRFRRAFPLTRRFMRAAMRIDDDGARRSEAKMMEGLDRLDAELDGRGYLAGDRFGVADLSAAALLFPLTRPPEGLDIEMPDRWPPALEELRSSVADRPFFGWVNDMYRRHRGHSAEIPA